MSAMSRTRRWWTEKEDQILRQEADLQLSQGALKDWNAIAAKLPGRTNKDCRKRWSKVCEHVKKGAWSSAEDKRLRAAVEQYGFRWTQVARAVGSRHADQCAKRWQHSLDPNIDHSEWSTQDEDRLLLAVSMHGRNWKTIGEKEFPTRSTTDIKNRHDIVDRKRRQAAGPGSAEASSSSTLTLAHPPNLAEADFDSESDSSEELLDDALLDIDCLLGASEHNGGYASMASSPSSMAETPETQTGSTLGSIPDPERQSRCAPGSTDDLFGQKPLPWDDGPMVLDPWQPDAPYLERPVQTPIRRPSGLMGGGKEMAATSTPTSQTTLILEDAQPDTLNTIINTLLQNGTKFQMSLQSGLSKPDGHMYD